MGIEFVIGNGEIEWGRTMEHADDWQPGNDWSPQIRVGVERIDHPDAPTFLGDGFTGRSNLRSLSYGGWADFAETCGLEDFATYISREHSGCVAITGWSLGEVKKALARRRKLLPDVEPGFSVPDTVLFAFGPGTSGMEPLNTNSPEVTEIGKSYDHHLARLVWFEWWMEWALENCKHPCIENF